MYYQWVERSPSMANFGGTFLSPEKAIDWGKEWLSGNNYTPEHLEIFLIVVDKGADYLFDIYKDGNGKVVSLKSLLS